MSHGFDQLDWPVHRMDLAAFGLDIAVLPAVGTLDSDVLFGSHLAGSRRLNQPAQALANFVSRHLDLVVVRRPRPLLSRLQLGGDLGGLFQQIGEFLFQLSLLRVHAILREN
jgi:hypothetical protein